MKYRHDLLTPTVEEALQSICQEIDEEKGFLIQQIEVGERDHVHVFASAHPKIAPSYIVKMLKGISARKLFMQFPELKEHCWDGHLWNGSYYLETIGSISEENVRRYIENQKKRGD